VCPYEMPTYEYKCEACGHKFERFQSITAAPIKKCPECKKNKVKRLIGTGAGLIFKGSGFYITDYRSEGYKKEASADSGGGEKKEPAKSSEGGASTEAKPAAKSDAPAAAVAPKAQTKPAPPSKSESPRKNEK
jgi:putative FmdB family regulatory protein